MADRAYNMRGQPVFLEDGTFSPSGGFVGTAFPNDLDFTGWQSCKRIAYVTLFRVGLQAS